MNGVIVYSTGAVQRLTYVQYVVDCRHGSRSVRCSLQTTSRARIHQRAWNAHRHCVGVHRLDRLQPAAFLALPDDINATR